MTIDRLVAEIDAALAARATEKRREGASRYISTELEVIGVDTPNMRAVVREFSKRLKNEPPAVVHEIARTIAAGRKLEARQTAYELIARHKPAFASVTGQLLEELGEGNDNWASVDGLACELAGPAWLAGHIPGRHIMKWARSGNLWWRRTAIVCTTALNKKSRGGPGDPKRTFMVCDLFVSDSHPMISKAVSWALRELCKRCPEEVSVYLNRHEPTLPRHVLREVLSKMTKGVKHPRRR